ncbi:B-zip transcription factor [Aspergillus sclerotialis]|uniref:B-zip transcription factor n=1 Tax=Aspergillus sclerotialis TaxID=2070753 RepID=A0A3A2ZS61_9EURO|nr:B-zip transcription factor [Aspergillus sclerotialis]
MVHAIPLLRADSFVHVCQPQETHLLKKIEGENRLDKSRNIVDPDKETTPSKKRESRVGARKVTTLSSEQLERKRANDREAQRTIRQRTREHIEQLEHQVAELSAKGDQFDNVVRRNAALEEELHRLKYQLSMMAGRQSFSDHEPTYSGPAGPSMSLPFPNAPAAHSARVPSTLPPSNQIPVAPAWQPYNPTPPQTLYDSPGTGYANRVEPYILEGQFPAQQIPQAAAPMSTPNQIGFSAHGSQATNPAIQAYPYNPHQQHSEPIPRNTQQVLSYEQSQRPMSAPAFPSENVSGDYPVLRSTPQTPHHMSQQQTSHTYNYSWGSQS